MNLKESLEQFTAPVYGKTRRTAETYQTVAQHCTGHLNRLVEEYRTVRNDQQLLHRSFGFNQHCNRTFFLALFCQNNRLNSAESNCCQPSLLPRRSTRNDE